MLPGEGVYGSKLGGSSLKHDCTATVASFWTHIYDAVRMGDHGLVVLDAEHGGAGIDQLVEQGEELLNIGQVQTGGGLVEDIGDVGERGT